MLTNLYARCNFRVSSCESRKACLKEVQSADYFYKKNIFFLLTRIKYNYRYNAFAVLLLALINGTSDLIRKSKKG